MKYFDTSLLSSFWRFDAGCEEELVAAFPSLLLKRLLPYGFWPCENPNRSFNSLVQEKAGRTYSTRSLN